MILGFVTCAISVFHAIVLSFHSSHQIFLHSHLASTFYSLIFFLSSLGAARVLIFFAFTQRNLINLTINLLNVKPKKKLLAQKEMSLNLTLWKKILIFCSFRFDLISLKQILEQTSRRIYLLSQGFTSSTFPRYRPKLLYKWWLPEAWRANDKYLDNLLVLHLLYLSLHALTGNHKNRMKRSTWLFVQPFQKPSLECCRPCKAGVTGKK